MHSGNQGRLDPLDNVRIMSVLSKHGADLVRATLRQVKEGRPYVTLYDPQHPSGVPFVIEPSTQEDVVLDLIFAPKPPLTKRISEMLRAKTKPIALEIDPKDVGGEFMGTLQDPFDNSPGSLLEVWRVDGTLLRDMGSYSPNKELGLGSMDWVCGGTFGRYPEFVPYNHVWIERSLAADDAPTLLHEVTERALMLGKWKLSYNKAHEQANIWEAFMRRNRSQWDEAKPIEAVEKAVRMIHSGVWKKL